VSGAATVCVVGALSAIAGDVTLSVVRVPAGVAAAIATTIAAVCARDTKSGDVALCVVGVCPTNVALYEHGITNGVSASEALLVA